MRKRHWPILAGVALLLAGCAHPRNDTVYDPLEGVNRRIFAFNQMLDNRAALPAATYYKSVAPEGLRDGLHNFLDNLVIPVTFCNDLLQGHVDRARDSLARFGINTTIGIVGIRDPATGMGYPAHNEDFGQTLAVYGVPGGPYLVLPLLGSTLPRDLAGELLVDHYFNPLGYLSYNGKIYVSWSEDLFRVVDVRSRHIDALRDIERSSIDYYATVRNIYIQRRNAQIDNDTPPPVDSPNLH